MSLLSNMLPKFANGAIFGVGLLLALIGLFLIASVWFFGVSFARSNCQGGESPVPYQGCGYVPYLELYVLGDNAILLQAIIISIAGALVLLLRLFLAGFRYSQVSTFLTLGVIALVAIVSIASVYTSFQIYTQLEPMSGAQYLQQCSETWAPQSPGPNTTQVETFVAMTLNQSSTAKICLQYNSAGVSPATAELNGLALYASNLTKVPTTQIGVSPDPKTIEAPPLQENGAYDPYAVFTLTTSDSSQGFYLLLLSGMCPMPLAVGYNQINYSDFAYGLQHEEPCSTDGLTGYYVSIENVGVAYS
jgi:hypothetical protein